MFTDPPRTEESCVPMVYTPQLSVNSYDQWSLPNSCYASSAWVCHAFRAGVRVRTSFCQPVRVIVSGFVRKTSEALSDSYSSEVVGCGGGVWGMGCAVIYHC